MRGTPTWRRDVGVAIIVWAGLALGRVDVAHSAVPSPPSKTGEILISAALVDHEMQVRPVPLHGILIVSSEGDTIRARTGVDGKAVVSVPVGACTVASVAPTDFQGQKYRWSISVTVPSGRSVSLALTNDNATVEQTPIQQGRASGSERLDAAAALFERFKRSVFRIEAGLAHGTGFLADTLGGVVITNAHVVESAEATDLSAVLDSRTRVRAQLLARDSDSDIAVLRLDADHMNGRPRIPLQHLMSESPVVPGERLVALGYPLHQELSITTGIASSVRAGAIISDVNINPGNSGGPLLNIDGEAVGVNTFGDVSNRGGPGISGSVLMARAGPALAQAATELARSASPPTDLLPSMPEDRLEAASLRAYVDSVDLDLYRDFTGLDVGQFELTVQTPIQTIVATKVYENEIAKDRKKREARAGLPESERYSEIREYRDWGQYVGAPTTPVVSISIVPKMGETGGSVFKRMMLGQNLQATYKFKGDVKGVQVFRNGEPVAPIRGGHTPMTVFQENRWISLKDVADQGIYIYDVTVLHPDSAGAPPSVVVAIRDLKSPKKLKCVEVPAEVVARAWNDFEGFYQEKRPTEGFHRADAKAAKKRVQASRGEFLKDDCNWPAY